MANKVLVTGASGTIGQLLVQKLLAQNHEVWALRRTPDDNIKPDRLYTLIGDVTKEDLCLGSANWSYFDSVYHLAGIVNLSLVDKDDLIVEINCYGTARVIKFCEKYGIQHLYYCGTAYAYGGRNPYENSKLAAEVLVKGSKIPKITIFKPSLVLGGHQHFSQFVSLLIFLHRRVEIVRRRVEGTLRLPGIEPIFRIKGDEAHCLNLVTSEAVADAMANINDEGTFWLTNPHPPTLEYLGKIVGEFIMVNLQFRRDFPAMPLEIAFQKLAKPFLPYLLEGDNFPSDLPDFKLKREDIDKELLKLIR